MKAKFLIFAVMLASLSAATLHAQTTATPAITLATGTYAMPTSTTITDSTSGASILWCYIASGTCTPATAYTASIYLNPATAETICANATASGYSVSSTVCHTYTNGGTITATPVISLATGTYTMPTSTTITDSTSGAAILWCSVTSGTCTPATSYTAAITINPGSAVTICASATASGYSASSTACSTYTNAGSGGGTSQWTTSGSNIYYNSGFVGIGTINPEAPFTVSSVVVNGLGNNITLNTAFATGADVNLVLGGDLNGTSIPYLQSRSGGSGNVIGSNNYNLAFNPYGGNVGIGTTNPTRKLHIAGDVQIDGNLYFGTNTMPQSASYAGVQCTGADYAEAVDITGDRAKYEPGDVMVIDPSEPGKFLKANEPYSTLVAGIYSTKPGFVGRKQPATAEASATEVPMAMVGRVPTKVTAENGPIKVGDLLVASHTPGHAMKGTDRSLLTGAVIGKALGSLDSGTGVIEVLVTLQ